MRGGGERGGDAARQSRDLARRAVAIRGQVFACYWPNQLSTAMAEQFDARVVEVVPSTHQRHRTAHNATDEVAWELLVTGHHCDQPPPKGCARSGGSQPDGWVMYSVERFYVEVVAERTFEAFGTPT